MHEAQWRILDGAGNEQGPYTQQALQGFFVSGHINAETMVWTEGYDQWYPAGQIDGLLPTPAPLTGAASMQTTANNDSSAPNWLLNVNLVTCIGALVLFFLPWLELRCSEIPPDIAKSMKEEQAKKGNSDDFNPATDAILIQSGFQSVTGEYSGPDDAEKETSNLGETPSGMTDDIDENFPPAHFVFIAVISLGTALLLSIFSFIKGNHTVLLLSQISCLVAGIFIAVQAGVGFPTYPGDSYANLIGEEGVVEKAAMFRQKFKLSYTPWFYIELALRFSSIIFIIVGLSKKKPSSTITYPQSGDQPGGMQFY